MAFRFEDLKVFHIAVDLSNKIDLITDTFPVKEKYSLVPQMKKAADSVILNIAEGSIGQSIPEFKRFLSMSMRSAIEVVAALYLCLKRNYISEEQHKKYYSEYEVLVK